MNDINLKAVLRQTGLTAETLRAWERRYGAVHPTRSANRRRLYSVADVQRLRLLLNLTRRGFRISALAGLTDLELTRQIENSRDPSEHDSATVRSRGVSELIDVLDRFDLRELRTKLAYVRYQVSPREFALELVPNLMYRVGTLIDEERFTIAQEHALSHLVQNELRLVYDSLESMDGTRSPLKKILFGTREGDFHEVGLILAATLCRSQGLQCQYLGPNLPAASLVGAVKTLQPSAVVLAFSYLPHGEERVSPQTYLDTINLELPPDTEIWIGGSASSQLKRPRSRRTIWIFESLQDLEEKLRQSLSKV